MGSGEEGYYYSVTRTKAKGRDVDKRRVLGDAHQFIIYNNPREEKKKRIKKERNMTRLACV